MTFGSVCSGIEAASVAWHPLGWRTSFVSEIEAFPSAVLAHRFPEVPNLGDFTTIQAAPEPIDVLVGGTPCQSFSVAGKRLGLDDPRGNLAIEFLRLARRLRPRWLVWENVPGLLSSSGGRDFGAFLGLMGELGYGWSYRILDAQYVRVDGLGRAVPQRRRRVFVVGHLGDWRRAAAVLFDAESVSGNPAPRREAETNVASALTRSLGSSGACDTRAQAGHLVAHSLRADGFDASEDGTGRGTPLVVVPFDTTQITSAGNYSNPKPGDPCHPLAATAHPPTIMLVADTITASWHRSGGATAGNNPGILNPILDFIGVRRLTPLECERLQGLPDGWTQVPFRRNPAKDGPRYKAIGNSMAIGPMRWIGHRINLMEAS